MMKRVYLTKYDQEVYDPTGAARRFLKAIDTCGADTPQMCLAKRFTRDEWLSKYQQWRDKVYSSRHQQYYAFDKSYDCKYGPQGHSFPLEKVLAQYEISYKLAERTYTPDAALDEALQLFLRMIKQVRDRVGYPQIVPVKVYNTSAALPTMLRKGTYFAECHVPGLNWRHVLPNLPGERYMKLKERVINQDAVSNVRYIERQLTAVRKWLRKNLPYFSAWLNPTVQTNKSVTKALEMGSWSVETDYDACDHHFSWALAKRYILPVYELLLPEAEYWHFAAMIEELFYQPIYFGPFMLTGLHNLLSGQGITNDFETIWDVILLLAACIVCGIPIEDIIMLVLGDDVALLIPFKVCKAADKVMDTIIHLSNSMGMDISVHKSQVRKNEVTFCKKIWYPAGVKRYGEIIGAYPATLALNSVINPEGYISDISQLLVATLQRLDNVEGAPCFEPFTQFVGSKLSAPKQAIEALRCPHIPDWWARVYDEYWDYSTSPTVKVWSKCGLLSKFITL